MKISKDEMAIRKVKEAIARAKYLAIAMANEELEAGQTKKSDKELVSLQKQIKNS